MFQAHLGIKTLFREKALMTFKRIQKIVVEVAKKLVFNRPEAPLRGPIDISAQDEEILSTIKGKTMTSLQRQITLINAVRYIVRNNLPGVFVECGVWRGGSAMAIAMTLLQEGATNRDLYLFDTFEGMTPPKSVDRMWSGDSAQKRLDQDVERKGLDWAVASIDDVRENMILTGYSERFIHYIKGPVEKTIPHQFSSNQIALLRLDTDWYSSTKHELNHLYPLIVKDGILIIDDYGWWEGAKKAVDEYFSDLKKPFYLHRIDETGRCLVK